MGIPEHPFENGVTVMLVLIGTLVEFTVVNEEILSLPVTVGNPVSPLDALQSY